MTTVQVQGYAVTAGTMQRLDAAKPALRAMPAEALAKFEEIWKERFRIPVGKADNDPSNIHATVKVGGKVVATLYNSGASMTPNALAGTVGRLPSMGPEETLTGPALAQKRAQEIAKALGGTIEQAATAQTQAQWASRPPLQWTYDTAAMEAARRERDALVQERRSALDALSVAARTMLDAQIIAQSPG